MLFLTEVHSLCYVNSQHCALLWVFFFFFKYTMPCMQHYRVIQNSFIALKIPWALPVYPYLPAPMAPGSHLFPVSLVLPFPESRIIGIMQPVA